MFYLLRVKDQMTRKHLWTPASIVRYAPQLIVIVSFGNKAYDGRLTNNFHE